MVDSLRLFYCFDFGTPAVCVAPSLLSSISVSSYFLSDPFQSFLCLIFILPGLSLPFFDAFH